MMKQVEKKSKLCCVQNKRRTNIQVEILQIDDDDENDVFCVDDNKKQPP